MTAERALVISEAEVPICLSFAEAEHALYLKDLK